MIQTCEPCGERSFVSRRLVSSIVAAILVVCAHHDVDTHAPPRDFREKRPATHENRADHTDGLRSSQDYPVDKYRIEMACEIREKVRPLRVLAALR
jgi:type IV pilus biogenesis protein CpaD/CtpE